MTVLGAIREAFELFKKNKILLGISFAFLTGNTLFIKAFVFLSLEWLSSFYFMLYLVISEIVLVAAVKSLLKADSINLDYIWQALKKNTFRGLVFLVLYLFLFSIFVVVLSFSGVIFFRKPVESWGVITVFVLGFVFAYLLPYYFSVRFSVLFDTKTSQAILKTIKLYWGRLLDVFSLSFFVSMLNLLMLGSTLLVSLLVSSNQAKPIGIPQTLTFIGVQLNTPVGIVFSVILGTFFSLWISASITIYFEKLEEIGELDG